MLSGPATMARDRDWLERHIGPDEFATVTDISQALAMIPVMGPNARRLLQSHRRRPVRRGLPVRDVPRDRSRLRLRPRHPHHLRRRARLELLIPADLAVHVYDTIADAGQEYGLRPAGYHALDSLRMEKAYRSWGHDISAGDTPLEAGLSFAVAWDKPGGFTGRDALLRQREHGVGRRLVQFALRDPDAFAYHDEPVYRDGALVGRVEFGGLRPHPRPHHRARLRDRARTRHAALLVRGRRVRDRDRGERVPADASLRPRYDPASQRPRS